MAGAAAQGLLERKKNAEGEMQFAMLHLLLLRMCTGLTEHRGPHPGLTCAGPARPGLPETSVFLTYATLSASEITDCFVFFALH